MSRQRLILSISLCLLLLAGFNIVFAFATRNSPEKRTLQDLRTAPGKDVIAFGDSLIALGFQPTIFDRVAAEGGQELTSVNAGILNTYPVEQAIVLNEALRLSPKARIVVFGFFDFRLTAKPETKSDDLWGNRGVGLMLDPLKAQRLYTMDIGSRVETLLLSKVPLFAGRASPYFRVEEARERLASIGKDSIPAGGPTRFAQLEAASIEKFNHDCLQQVFERQPLSKPVLEMIREAKEHNARLVIVEMPASPEHVKRFYRSPAWKIYREYVRGLVEQQRAEFVDAGEWFPEQSFYTDELHLAPYGSEQFTRRLAKTLLDSH